MKIERFQKATQAEIDALASLIKKVEKPSVTQVFDPLAPPPSSSLDRSSDIPKEDWKDGKVRNYHQSLFEGGIAYAPITREALAFDNPVQLLMVLMPELTPYKWQFEELMRLAGYLDTGHYERSDKTEITRENPYKAIICAANGSGKDAILIAAFSVWFVLSGVRNRVVATSSSFDQLKGQTEIHIRELIKRADAKFGKLFRSVHFHHIVPELGGEIKLFATDEPNLAEGYHAFHGGKLARIINEAKTVTDDIFGATERWTGVSHTLLISSPGRRRGKMFTLASNATCYPARPVLGLYYFRRVTAFECPHIPPATIAAKIAEHGEQSPLVQSMIFANFSDFEEPIVIPESVFDGCASSSIINGGEEIAMGLDLAAGGDEDALFVRKGNRIIHSYFFRQTDTDLAADLLDAQLSAWKWLDHYTFNADNGGVGKGIIDKLVAKGWRINRCNNQSPANNKREYLNLGAESWMHLRRLLERKQIIVPKIPKLREQIIGRYFHDFENMQGKLRLESKKEARINGRVSPDRADAFVLCFWSYKPGIERAEAPGKDLKTYLTMEQLVALSYRGIPRYNPGVSAGRFTALSGPLVSKDPYGL